MTKNREDRAGLKLRMGIVKPLVARKLDLSDYVLGVLADRDLTEAMDGFSFPPEATAKAVGQKLLVNKGLAEAMGRLGLHPSVASDAPSETLDQILQKFTL